MNDALRSTIIHCFRLRNYVDKLESHDMSGPPLYPKFYKDLGKLISLSSYYK